MNKQKSLPSITTLHLKQALQTRRVRAHYNQPVTHMAAPRHLGMIFNAFGINPAEIQRSTIAPAASSSLSQSGPAPPPQQPPLCGSTVENPSSELQMSSLAIANRIAAILTPPPASDADSKKANALT